jgi:hypothetical protein
VVSGGAALGFLRGAEKYVAVKVRHPPRIPSGSAGEKSRYLGELIAFSKTRFVQFENSVAASGDRVRITR